VLSDADKAVCRTQRPSRGIFTDDEIAVIAFPVPAETLASDTLLTRLADNDLLRRRNVLVQSNFDPDHYLEIGEAPDRLAHAKLLHTATVCQLLGATRVEVVQVERTEASSSATWTASASATLRGSGSLQGESNGLARFVRETTLTHTFAGGAAKPERAQQFLDNKGLGRDQHLGALVEMRREAGNQLVEQRIEISTVEESKRLRKLAARCKLPFNEIQGELNTVATREVEYRFMFTVSF
jgi:hypothetical protein